MQVVRGEISADERSAFEQVVRASGREPGEFHIEVFTAAGACELRTVHVELGHCAAQYDTTRGGPWTIRFAQHLAGGRFH
jgi:hypothetical protein